MADTKKTIIVDGFNLNIVFGKTKTEWIGEHKNHDSEEELWDFPIEELLDGTIEPNEEMVYWLINGRLYETFEQLEKEVDLDCRYSVYIDGEEAESFGNLDDAINLANKLFGKGYTDDITIYDNKLEDYIDW